MPDPDPLYGLQHVKKMCHRCRRQLPLWCFYRHRGMPDGLTRECRACLYEPKRLETRAELEVRYAA